MDVILKKTKITANILNQTLTATKFDLMPSEVIGFCIYKKRKWIVLYKPSLNELKRYPMLADATIHQTTDQKGFWVKVAFVNYNSIYYELDSLEQRDSFIALMKSIKNTAVTKGQFFI